MLKLLQRKRRGGGDRDGPQPGNRALPGQHVDWNGKNASCKPNKTSRSSFPDLPLSLSEGIHIKSYLGCYYKVRPIPELRDIGRSDEPTHDVLKE